VLGVPNLSTIQLLLGLNALLLAPVLYIVSVWISAFGDGIDNGHIRY
jgi:hypothetical protein